MAKHGFEKHEHNGHVCDIYLHSEHTKYNTPGTAIALMPLEYVTLAVALPGQPVVHSESHGVASPRAPPLFS